jgi:AmiR/NasT family two-component response regulator
MDGAQREPAAPQPVRVRMLVADEDTGTLARMVELARSLGHDVVARELAPAGVARAVREESPELAVIALHEDADHALDLIREVVEEGICPVIVQTNGADAEFAARAAEFGAYALSTPADPDALQASIEIAKRRFEEQAELSEEVESLEGALRRRALVERAKGPLMERHQIGERPAFELLRSRARATNRTVVNVAESVLEGQPLPPGGAD